MKYILLVTNKNEYEFKYINSDHCHVFNVYKNPTANIVAKLFRKFVYFIGSGRSNIFYDDWTSYLNDEDAQFIVFDSCRPYHRLRKKLLKAKRKPIIYFWNPISEADRVDELKKYFEVYSYSCSDSQKYGLKYNPQFYVGKHVESDGAIEYDGIFLGKNKGRLQNIERAYTLFDKPYFHVVRDGSENSSILPMTNERMAYIDYLKLVSRSRSIVEILCSDNADYSLRTMEALFYQKKLITDNKLIKNAPFYDPNNIYVLTDDTTKQNIEEFLALPFKPYSKEQVDYYNAENWLRRFEIMN